MIVACVIGMIPFMITMVLMTITYAMVDLNLDRDDLADQTWYTMFVWSINKPNFATNFMD